MADLHASEWAQVSRLLDVALELPSEQRSNWLRDLATRDAALAAAVGRFLERSDGASLGDAAASFERLLPGILNVNAVSDVHGAAGLVAAPSDLAGSRFGAWTLSRKIGEGGMGQVWLAERADRLYEAVAAIKLLRTGLQAGAFLARFERERRVLSRMHHPDIARLFDAGVEAGTAYLVLEYVEGMPLCAYAAANDLSAAESVVLTIRIARAVEYAHAQLIVHRDLKPANIVVTGEGVPKLLDFGIASLIDDDAEDGPLTRQWGRVLTLGYAAPEQITGGRVGVGADVYSLGVILYELLSGRLPFDGVDASRAAMEHAVLHGQPTKLGAIGGRQGLSRRHARQMHADLEAILMKTLRKTPDDRYANVTALIDDLQAWLGHRPVSARAGRWRYRAQLWMRRNRVVASLAGAALLTLASGLAATTWQWQRAEAAAATASRVTDYLTGVFESANPDAYGGQLPTELQLLQRSSEGLATRFQNDPRTHLKVLGMLVKTYTALNRYDLAIPLAERAVDIAMATGGADDADTVDARLAHGRIYIPLGPPENVIAQYEAVRPQVARLYGPDSETMQSVYHGLLLAYIRTGQLDLGEAVLRQAGRLNGLLTPPGSFDRAFFHAYEAKLYAAQGDLRRALSTLALTDEQQRHPPPSRLRFALVLRLSVLDLQIRLGAADGVVERIEAVRAEADRLLGPGNALSGNADQTLVRFHTVHGRYAAALGASERRSGTDQQGLPPYALRIDEARTLSTRVLAGAGSRAQLGAEAHRVAEQLVTVRHQTGFLAGAAWLDVARSALLLDEPALAESAIRQLRALDAPRYDRDVWLSSRIDQAEGGLARLRGEWARSRQLLQQRVAQLDKGLDQSIAEPWSARLDLACTLVAMHDPAASAALEAAAALRPKMLAPDHPLDALAVYLEAKLRRDSLAGHAGPFLISGGNVPIAACVR